MAQPGLFGGSAPGAATPAVHGAGFNTLDSLLGGWLTVGGRRTAEQQSAALEAQQSQALQQQIRQNVTDPQELMIALANPKAWSDERAKRYAPQQVTAGNTLLNGPGGSPYMAPKLVEDQGVYGTQGPGGYQQTGARAPSVAERQTQFKNAADIDAEIQRLQIAKGQLAVSQGQLGINRDAYNARLRGVGGFGTPGVGGGGLGGGDVPAGAGWEVQ